ncbi:MAG: hypothetical protein WAW96_21315 [Alphaproteobacteria bacterium]
MAKRAKPADPRTKLIKAGFDAAIRDGWRGLSIAHVAKSAGLSVGEAYKVAPDRMSLLDAYIEGIDAKAVEQMAQESDDDTWRDIAFDGFMRRFDAMLKDRDALRVIYFDDRRDLIALAHTARRTRRSIERVLEASGFANDTLTLLLGATALVPLYARVFRTWLNDEADQAKTMATLDKALQRFERLAARFMREREARPGEDSGDEDRNATDAPSGSVH